MTFTDTHTHLYSEQFDTDRNECVKTAIDAGIKRMVLPAIDSKYIATQKKMIERFPENCFAAAGLHPSSVKEDFKEELKLVETELASGLYIAVGETGIDLYWDTTFRNEQEEAFSYQIELAKKYRIPIIIHVRNAFEEAYAIIKNLNDEKLSGVFHSFTGTAEQAKRICDLNNFKIGINGIVTFKNSDLAKRIKDVPLEYIVPETDSPYLSPSPKRGKRNESKHLIHIVEKIADIYGKNLAEISEITEKNAAELFNNFRINN